MGSAWGRPRPAPTVLMTARTDGRRCRGGVSATGEGRRCSSSCVALRRDKGKQPGPPGDRAGEKSGLEGRRCGPAELNLGQREIGRYGEGERLSRGKLRPEGGETEDQNQEK